MCEQHALGIDLAQAEAVTVLRPLGHALGPAAAGAPRRQSLAILETD